MTRYVMQRILGMLAVMFTVVTIVFVIVRVAPGDPAAVMLGPDATAADIAGLRARLGLDQSLPTQYVLFLGQLLRGDLGQSIFLNMPVLSALAERAEPTFLPDLVLDPDRQRDRAAGRYPLGLQARHAVRPGRDHLRHVCREHSELLARADF